MRSVNKHYDIPTCVNNLNYYKKYAKTQGKMYYLITSYIRRGWDICYNLMTNSDKNTTLRYKIYK